MGHDGIGCSKKFKEADKSNDEWKWQLSNRSVPLAFIKRPQEIWNPTENGPH